MEIINKYTAVIIGCGSIGAMKPKGFDSPTTKNELTHAHAIYNITHRGNKCIKLLGFIDLKKSIAQAAAIRWSSSIYKSSYGKPDIVIISTPTDTHLNVVKFVVNELEPKLIIFEKPVGRNLLECTEIKEIAKRPIAVHYNRRYEIEHQRMARQIHMLRESNGIYCCHIKYGRGLLHDGSHALDLMNWWFGEPREVYHTNKIDELKGDFSYGFAARWEGCPQIVFTPVDSKYVGMFEIDIITFIGNYSFISNGTRLAIRPVKSGCEWGDYPVLHSTGRSHKTNLTKTLHYLYKNVWSYLRGSGEPLRCTIDDALKVHKTYKFITDHLE